MSDCIVTWAADTLGNETPHEVGTVLAPVWPTKRVYLELEMTWLNTRHILQIVSMTKLENLPFHVLDTVEIILWSHAGAWDPSPNESICIYKAD